MHHRTVPLIALALVVPAAFTAGLHSGRLQATGHAEVVSGTPAGAAPAVVPAPDDAGDATSQGAGSGSDDGSGGTDAVVQEMQREERQRRLDQQQQLQQEQAQRFLEQQRAERQREIEQYNSQIPGSYGAYSADD